MIEQVGQLVMVGFDGLEVDEHLRRMIEEFYVGGVILFRRNVRDADQVRALTGKIQELGKSSGYKTPILIAVDQEGGVVNRITRGIALSPGNMALGALGDEGPAYETGKIVGRELAAIGVNMNLAPVLDLARNRENHLGTRCFGNDPELVGNLGSAYAQGLAESGVQSIGKHFLGYDGSITDPHDSLPYNRLTRKELNPSIRPFGIAGGRLQGVMSAHVILSCLGSNPVTFSHRVITGILRKELGFDGVVLTDCLEMGAIQERFDTGEAAIKALKAGGDFLLVSHSETEQRKAIEAIRAARNKGMLKEDKLNESLARVRSLAEAVKDKKPGSYPLDRDRKRLEKIAGRAITVIGDDPPVLVPGEEILLVTPKFSGRSLSPVEDEKHKEISLKSILEEHGIEVTEIEYRQEFNPQKILEGVKQKGDKLVVLALEPDETVKNIARAGRSADLDVILVALEKPWGFEGVPADTLLFTYGRTRTSLRGLGAVLRGNIEPAGSPPVDIQESHSTSTGKMDGNEAK